MTDTARCEAVERWIAEGDAEKALCERATSTAEIAKMAGIPEWLVFKVVSLEMERRVMDATKGSPDSPREALALIITEAISYARELTRVDGWRPVWKQRRMSALKGLLRDYAELMASRTR
jgi:hypothetical protein